MVARKSLIEKPKKKDSEFVDERKVSSKLNVDSMDDAVVDGKFVGSVGDELIVVKPRDGKIQKSICTVKKIEGEEVYTWDETKNQWYIFACSGIASGNVIIKRFVNN